MASSGVLKQSQRRRNCSSFTNTDAKTTEQLQKRSFTEYLLQVDIELSEKLSFCATKNSSSWRSLLVLLEISGHGVPWIAAAVLGILMCGGTQQQFACNILLALLLDLAIVGSTKILFQRKRPIYNEKDMFATVSVDNYSFPSGHSTRAAMVAGIIVVHLTNQIHKFLVCVWAVCVACSRVALGRHHISDVICGVVIGVAQFRIMMMVWLPEQLCQTLTEDFLSLGRKCLS